MIYSMKLLWLIYFQVLVYFINWRHLRKIEIIETTFISFILFFSSIRIFIKLIELIFMIIILIFFDFRLLFHNNIFNFLLDFHIHHLARILILLILHLFQ